MNSSELVTIVAEAHDISKAQVQAILDSVLKSIVKAAASDDEVSLAGFGKFKIKASPEREGRNPANGEKIKIAASKKLSFSPAKAVKDVLNAGTRAPDSSALFGSWGHQSSLILRMPLKRATPSFTVEYRQAKRPNTGTAKLGWAHAKPAPPGSDGKANRIAISAFKIVAAKPPADGRSPPMPSGRILPSLVETAPVTGQADAGSAQSRSH